MTLEVGRIDAPTHEAFYRRYVATNTPVIVRGLLDRSPALTRWTPAFLKEALGDVVVRPEVSDVGQFSTYAVDRREEMPFSRFVEAVTSGPQPNRLYLTNRSLAGEAKSQVMRLMTADVELPPYFRSPHWYMRSQYRDHNDISLFVGGGGNVTTLHYDSCMDVMLILVRGRKRVTLFAPSNRRYLYPSSPWQWSWVFNSSPVNVLQPDLERHPRFRHARPIVCMLEEGEVLYLPACWWHHIESFGFNVALNLPLVLSAPRLLSGYGYDRCVHVSLEYLRSRVRRVKRRLRLLRGLPEA